MATCAYNFRRCSQSVGSGWLEHTNRVWLEAAHSATPVPLLATATLLDEVPGRQRPAFAAAQVEDMDAVDMTSTRVTSAEVSAEEDDDSSVTMCTWLAVGSCGTGDVLVAAGWGHLVALCRPPQQPQAIPNL